MTDRDAYIILNMISGVGPAKVRALTGAFGSASEILKASVKKLCSVQGINQPLADAIASWKNSADLKNEISMAERAGVEIITFDDKKYPSTLREIHDPPLCIYARGQPPSEEELMLGIVGSRRITNYGRMMSEHLSQSAVFAGWTVVSGLAYGADAAAHKAAVEAGGRTIAVLGGGLARIFPQDHIPLARNIVEKEGAIISEFPMEFPPSRQSFPMRNRIISGLSKGVLVVEAGAASGALITAKFALEQGRLVFAVPGQADNPQARGCNALIKEGAKLTENFDDVLSEFEFLPKFASKKTKDIEDEKSISDEKTLSHLKLSDDECKIIALLEKGETGADELVSKTGLETGKLLSILTRMELKKIIVQMPAKRFALRK